MRLLVTVVHTTERGEQINTRYADFRSDVEDPALVDCALDAAWTAMREGRVADAERAIDQVVPASLAGWWYLVLPACARPPRVS